jgi:hypothetical protein
MFGNSPVAEQRLAASQEELSSMKIGPSLVTLLLLLLLLFIIIIWARLNLLFTAAITGVLWGSRSDENW